MSLLFDLGQPSTRFLCMQSWFNRLRPAVRQRISERVFTQSAGKGDVLLKSGECVQGWYGVMSGLVQLESHCGGGRASAFLGIPGGEWFGEGAAMEPEPRRYEVVALRDTELLCLPLDEFNALRCTSLEFNQALLLQMNARLRQAMAIIEAGRISSPQQRVALYLSRGLWPGSRKLLLSQDELARLIGLSRQTVNRVLKLFEAMNLVSLQFGRLGILNAAGLLALASPCGPAAPEFAAAYSVESLAPEATEPVV